jgi:hypothetical protein
LVVAVKPHAGVKQQGRAFPGTPACNLFTRASSKSSRHPRHPLPGGRKQVKLAKYPVLGVVKTMNQRRASQRIPMELPVEIRWKGRAGSSKQAMGKTGNISGSGLFMELPVRLHRETSVTIKVVLPRKGSHVPLELLCQGRIVRWSRHGQVRGLGAVIDEYELRPAPQCGSGGSALREAND